MSSSRRFTRREAVIGGAATVAVAAAAVVVSRAGDEGDDAAPSSTAASVPATPVPTAPPPTRPPVESVALLGEAYLAAYPDDADPVGLSTAVPEITGTTAAARLSALPALTDRIRQEFTAGTTIVLDGWVLARCEGQAAALVSLGS